MEGRIVTDISVLIFFIVMTALRRYLFTEGFLKFLKGYWYAFGFPVAIVPIHFTSEKPSPYQEFIVIIGLFFVGYFFLYGYFSVNISSLRNRKGFRKKWQIVVLPFISLLTLDQAYDYFTTEPYHVLEIVIFIFFLGTVIFISRFLLKETFFSEGEE